MVKPQKSDSKALECLKCEKRYSYDDVVDGLYQIETMICSKCYASLAAKPSTRACFGKPPYNIVNDDTGKIKRLPGYNPKDPACVEFCADRNICRRIVMEVEEEYESKD